MHDRKPAPLPRPALLLLFPAIHGTVETRITHRKEPRLDWFLAGALSPFIVQVAGPWTRTRLPSRSRLRPCSR